MKKFCIFSFMLLVIFLSGCKDENELINTSSPLMTVSSMNILSSSDISYDGFKKLFVDGKNDKFIKKKYDLVRDSQTSGSSTSTLALVQYLDGKSLLIDLRHDQDTDQYLIHNIIEVPEEVAVFFKKNVK